MNKIYVAIIGSGGWEDYSESEVFASFDKDKVEKWVGRFNKIVEDNRDRIISCYDDDNYDKPSLFWHDFIAYSKPIASAKSVKFKF